MSDLLLVAVGNLEADADHLGFLRIVLVREQPVDDPVAGVHVALLVEVELAAIEEVARHEGEAARLAELRVSLRDLRKQLKRPPLQLLGGQVEELLLGGGVEELDRESRHLQAELRRIEARLPRDVGKLNPLARVRFQGLADLLGGDQLVQNLGQNGR